MAKTKCCTDRPKLNHLITWYEEGQEKLDSFGAMKPGKPRDLGNRWASIKPMKGRERFSSEATQAIMSHKVTMRYWPGLQPDMWFEYRGRRFNVVAAINEDEADEWHLLECMEEL